MADRLHFTHLGKTFDFASYISRAKRFGRGHGGHVQIGKLVTDLPGRALLEDQRFVLIDMLADFFDHRDCSFVNAAPTVSMCSRRDISVAHRSMAPSSSG